MAKLPQVKGREVVAALGRAGWYVDEKSGGHWQLRHPTTGRKVTVPMHPGPIKRGTLGSILDQAGLNDEMFVELLR